jgi:hypothetical protein
VRVTSVTVQTVGHGVPLLPPRPARFCHDLAVPPGRQDELIAYGPLLSDNGATWLGTAVLVRAPDPDKARAILTPDRYADIEVHNWRFGGRAS